jgi:hypothetical protein
MPAQKKATMTDEPNPMAFGIAALKWMDGASEQVAELREQGGVPTLGIDVHAQDYLTRIGRLLDEARADLIPQLPAEET